MLNVLMAACRGCVGLSRLTSAEFNSTPTTEPSFLMSPFSLCVCPSSWSLKAFNYCLVQLQPEDLLQPGVWRWWSSQSPSFIYKIKKTNKDNELSNSDWGLWTSIHVLWICSNFFLLKKWKKIGNFNLTLKFKWDLWFSVLLKLLTQHIFKWSYSAMCATNLFRIVEEYCNGESHLWVTMAHQTALWFQDPTDTAHTAISPQEHVQRKLSAFFLDSPPSLTGTTALYSSPN